MALNKGFTGYFRPPSAPYPPLPATSPTPVGATFTNPELKVAYHSAIHSPLPGDNQSPPTIHAPQTWGKHVLSNNTVAGVGASNAPCWPSQPRPSNHQGQQCQSPPPTQPIMLHIPGGPKPHTFSSERNKHSTENDLHSGQPFQGVGQASSVPAPDPLLPYPPQQFFNGHYTSPVCTQPHQEQSHRVASLNRNNKNSRNGSYTTYTTSGARGGIWGGASTPPPPAPYPPLPQSAPRSMGPQFPEESITNHHHWSAMCSPLPEDRLSPPQGPQRENQRDRDTGDEKQQRHPRLPQPPNCDSSWKPEENVTCPEHLQAMGKASRSSAEENGNRSQEHHHQQSRHGFSLEENPTPASDLESDRKQARQSSRVIEGTGGYRGNISHNDRLIKEYKWSPARDGDAPGVPGHYTPATLGGPREKERINGCNSPSYSIKQKCPGLVEKNMSHRPDREGKEKRPDSKPRRVEDPRLAHGLLKIRPSVDDGSQRRDGRVRDDSSLSGQKHIERKDRARGRADERVEGAAHEGHRLGKSVPRRVEDPRLAHGRLKIRPSADDGSQCRDGRVRDDSNVSGQKHIKAKDRARGRAHARVEGAAREGHRLGRQGVGKSCPPPRGGKDRSVGSTSFQVQGEDKLVEILKQIDALEVHATNKSPSAEGRVDVATRAYFSLEEYKAAEKAGDVVYKGKSTVEELYGTGKAYNPTTRRWIKVENEKKKAAIQAAPSLLANVEMLENTVKLLTQRSQLLETKAEILKEQSTRPTVTLTSSTAPKLIVFDTNCFIHHLGGVKCRVADIAARELDMSVLVPKAVLAELDGLKKNETKGFSAREASRYLKSLLQMDEKRKFSVARFQEDVELYRDDGHHSAPHCLRGDASILNCCMFFAQGVTTPREVTLVTGDNNFEMQARANRFRIEGLPRCLGERCLRPCCPARSQQRF